MATCTLPDFSQLFSRAHLLITHVGTGICSAKTPKEYALGVASGYRPARNDKIPEELWDIIQVRLAGYGRVNERLST